MTLSPGLFYLLASVVCSVAVAAMLKLARRWQVDVRQAIMVNHAVAALLCWTVLRPDPAALLTPQTPWLVLVALGLLLPSGFMAMALAVRHAGVVRSDAAQRLSLFIPLLAAFLLFGEPVSGRKLGAIALAFAALFCLLRRPAALPAAQAPETDAAARRALRLDPDSSRAYAALAFNAFYWKRDLKASMEMFAKALEIDPNNASANAWYALMVMQDRQFGTALSAIARAEKLLPQAPEIKANKALILFHSGHAEEALAILLPLAETQPNMLSPHAYLATILLDTGRYQDFIREYRLAAEIEENGARLAIADTGERGLKAGGGQGMLEAMYAEQLSQFARGKEPAFKLALTATMLGQRERAVEYLGQSVRRGEADRFGLMLEPALKPLWTEPRFQQLARQLKLTS